MEQETANGTTSKAAQTAEAEKNKGATAVDLGKFTSVEALYRAYERLEAEFTRRSQRLKALEEGVAVTPSKDTQKRALTDTATGNNVRTDRGEVGRTATSEELKSVYNAENKPDEVFPHLKSDQKSDYLNELVENKSSANFCKGSALYAPPFKPKNIAEAGELAKAFIKFKGEF